MNAYKHGWDCFTHGLDWNPYNYPSGDYDDWAEGWRQASNTQTGKQLRERVLAIFL